MRIALFVHCFFPDHFYGTETYTFDLARNLLEMGHEAVVVSAIFPGERGTEQITSYYEFQGIPVHCIDKNHKPNIRIKDTYYQPANRDVLRALLIRIKPDVVHVTHLINHTAVLLEVARELAIPTVATLTDFFGFCYNNKLEAADGSLCRGPNRRRTNCLSCHVKASGNSYGAGRLSRLLAKPAWCLFTAHVMYALQRVPGYRTGALAGTVQDIARRPDILAECYASYRAVIAPTHFLRDAYIANGLQVPIRNIRFGIDFPRGPKAIPPADAPLRFGFIGQIAPHKGTDILIDAFRQLPSGSCELHIFGPDDQDPSFMAELRLKAAGCAVQFRGTFPKDYLPVVFDEIDVLVIPSRWYENSPLVLLNALASHTPVIVSDVAGMTEFVDEGVNGYVFDRGNVQDLIKVMQSIVDCPDKAHALFASTHYQKTTAAMTREVLEIYEASMTAEG
ncbi:MAG: Mannosylfructose-phosphate synthase [Chromatiales bacterium USCg_Taylor]|nr:MAG: Mannosylfructose-phosphate synthase [Chromatiales bacterium USCg_Taylor]